MAINKHPKTSGRRKVRDSSEEGLARKLEILAAQDATSVAEFLLLTGFSHGFTYKCAATGKLRIKKRGRRSFIERTERLRFLQEAPDFVPKAKPVDPTGASE